MTKNIRTNQRVVEVRHQGTIHEEEFLICHKCKDQNDLIGMRSSAYYDPYRYHGKYVHKQCLSDDRKIEIVRMIQEYRNEQRKLQHDGPLIM